MMKRFCKYLLPVFLVAVIINSCEKDPVEDDKTVKVTGVSLDKSVQELTFGDSFTLTATIEPSEATNKELIWACSNDQVIKIEEVEDGTIKVTAIDVGEATIAVQTVDGNFTKFCLVTVIPKITPVTGVKLEPVKVTITEIGKTVQLTHTIIPADATNPTVEFTSSNKDVATVNKSTGLVTAVGVGTTIITVTTSDGAHTATCEVTVYIPITDVSLDIEEQDLDVGEELTLTLTIEPANATFDEVKWTTSDEAVATVDQNGKVTATGLGEATITVTVDDEFTATCKISVPLKLSAEEKMLMPNDEWTLLLNIDPADYTQVKWESSDPTVASVDQNGKVTAADFGEAIITVTVDNKFTATCKITVTVDLKIRREHRGAWITTVWDIDWPGTRIEAEQKQRYINILNMYQAANFNAVYVQVRGMADPFWESIYESWSLRISGTAGKAPNYDVMRFLIDEAHARNMEFHAWINPYRIATRTAAPIETNPWPPLSDPKIPPDFVKDTPGYRVYNPALPEVHQHIPNIVEEMIRKYPDIDGVHMDDYFYPTPNIDDDDDFEKYGIPDGYGRARKNDWRRANVDKAIQNIQKTIIRVNPRIVFSVSPQGNENNNYNQQFADVLKWCQNHWIDMVIPQIYYLLSSFTTTLDTWSRNYAPHVPCLVGYPIYRINVDAGFTTESFDKMHELARGKNNILGGIYYNTSLFTANLGGAADVVRKYYDRPAVRPVVGRITESPPVIPENVTINGATLSWSAPAAGLTSVVYLIPEGKTVEDAYLVAITKENSLTVTEKGKYLVTTFNKNNVESSLSKSVIFN